MTKTLLIILAGVVIAAALLTVGQSWVEEPFRAADAAIADVGRAGGTATGDQLRAMNAAVREAAAENRRRANLRDQVLLVAALLFAVSLVVDRVRARRKRRSG